MSEFNPRRIGANPEAVRALAIQCRPARGKPLGVKDPENPIGLPGCLSGDGPGHRANPSTPPAVGGAHRGVLAAQCILSGLCVKSIDETGSSKLEHREPDRGAQSPERQVPRGMSAGR